MVSYCNSLVLGQIALYGNLGQLTMWYKPKTIKLFVPVSSV